MRILSAMAGLFLGLMALAPNSQAATVSYDVTFSATNFVGIGTPPVTTVNGAFRVTLDPTQTYLSDATTISNFTIDLPGFTDTPVLTYFPIFGGTGSLGGSANGALVLASSAVDFRLGFTLGGAVSEFTYQVLKNGHWRKYTTLFPSVTIASVPPATTPIPASLVMLLTSIGALGAFRLLRSSKVQPQHATLAA